MQYASRRFGDFLSNNKMFPVFLFCISALMFFGAVLFSDDLLVGGSRPSVAWTESAGLGTSVPACASGSMSTSCSGLQGALTLNVYNLHGGAAFVYADFWGGPLIWTSGYGGENYTVTLTGLD